MDVRSVCNVDPIGGCSVWCDDPPGVFDRHVGQHNAWWSFTRAGAARPYLVTVPATVAALEAIYRTELNTIAWCEHLYALPAAEERQR